jgi:CelD/BcsL family acetyltransferase involved in cellulose biosynthesis
MLSGELIEDVAALESLRPEWDELAVACGLPLMAPGTVMSWWHNLAPSGAEPRSVAVRDGDRLIGLAPFYVHHRAGQRVDYRLPGIEVAARLSPLAVPGREWEVAGVVGRSLSGAHPRPDLIALEGHPIASPWPVALREGWPETLRPPLRRYVIQSAPTVSLGERSFEDWLAGKSANFRSQMRRLRRQFAADGGIARFSTPDTVEADIATFMDLHAARWRQRGHSDIVAMGHRYAGMLQEMSRSHLVDGRLRLWVLEIEGTPISAQLFIGAGGEVAYINGGWDERFARLKPAMLGILYAIEDALARKQARLDLGAGALPYKQRLADGSDPVGWTVLMAPGRRLALTIARTAPMLVHSAVRDTAKRALDPEQADRVRTLRAKLTR